MDELLNDFLTETNDSLETLDQSMVDLEATPENMEIIRDIFRVLHTIKGTCGFLGLQRLEKLAHVSENVLGKMREGELPFNADIGQALFDSIDRLKEITDTISETEEEGDASQDIDIIKSLEACLGESDESPQISNEEDLSTIGNDSVNEEASKSIDEVTESAPKDGDISDSDIVPESIDDSEKSDPTITKDSLEKEKTDPASVKDDGEGKKPSEEATDTSQKKENSPVETTSKPQPIEKSNPAKKAVRAAPIQTVRVGVDILDNLITIVSELVLTRNQLLQICDKTQDAAAKASLSRLSYITSELQEEVMKTRMESVDSAWAKVPRLIRDLTKDLGKKIQLEQNGGSTELDRQVIELIKDPLTHMIRNACDHGLETPEERVAAGKSEMGTVYLDAYHQGGQIIIEIRDDGRGIDASKLRPKIVEKGLVSADEAASLDDKQVLSYIFKPGFSTAEKVTSVSGRGVGMDVVKSNIEKLGGVVDLTSEVNKGSRFLIKIPLTLTIISALVLESGGEKFAIPQVAVSELLLISKHGNQQIEYINQTPVLRVREGLLPLIKINNLLQLKESEDNQEQYVVVINMGSTRFGIVVDKIFDTQEIVVKPLAKAIRSGFFSGSTILGDGSVIIILDSNAILSELNYTGPTEVEKPKNSARAQTHETTLMLIFKLGGSVKAVPLGLVSRISEISRNEVENVNDVDITKYQGYLMPVVNYNELSPMKPLPEAEEGEEDPVYTKEDYLFPSLVFTDRGQSVALAVDEIVNIVEGKIGIEIENKATGSLGTTLINGEATTILDTDHYLRKAYPDWFEKNHLGLQFEDRKIKLLLVEDNKFFQSLIVPVLSFSDYLVATALSADEAVEICKNEKDFDIIVSDIEMPGMNGFEFAAHLSSQSEWKNTPKIALSSCTTPEDLEKGRVAGFNHFIAKNDHKKLLDVLSDFRKEILFNGEDNNEPSS